jgi:hypothetical protein
VKTPRTHFPPSFQQTGSKKTPRPVTQQVSTYFRHFLSVTSKHSGFTTLNEKSETQKKNSKTVSGGSSIFALSIYTTFGQTQRCDNPFKKSIETRKRGVKASM